jgi:hypothetical protein
MLPGKKIALAISILKEELVASQTLDYLERLSCIH